MPCRWCRTSPRRASATCMHRPSSKPVLARAMATTWSTRPASTPSLGGEAALERLVAALRQHGMGLILDTVSNHMAVGGADNPWWQSVLAQPAQPVCRILRHPVAFQRPAAGRATAAAIPGQRLWRGIEGWRDTAGIRPASRLAAGGALRAPLPDLPDRLWLDPGAQPGAGPEGPGRALHRLERLGHAAGRCAPAAGRAWPA